MKNLVFLVILFQIKAILAQRAYINPSSLCFTNCSGSVAQPFKSLWAALSSSTNSLYSEFILLNSSSSDHYIMAYETNSSGYLFTYSSVADLNNYVTIRPLYCNDPLILNESSLLASCYQLGFAISVYLKSEFLRMNIYGGLSLQNLVFDGIEDISKYNSASTNLTNCLSQEVRCCLGNSLKSSLHADLNCSLSTLVSDSSGTGAFISIMGGIGTTLKIDNTTFKNMHFQRTKSLIKISQYANLNFYNISLSNFFFQDGIISNLSSSWIDIKMNFNIFSLSKNNPLSISQTRTMTGGLFLNTPFISNGLNITISDAQIFELELKNYESLVYLSDSGNITIANTKFQNISLRPTISYTSSLVNARAFSQINILSIEVGNISTTSTSVFHLTNFSSVWATDCYVTRSTLGTGALFFLNTSGIANFNNLTVNESTLRGDVASPNLASSIIFQREAYGNLVISNSKITFNTISGAFSLIRVTSKNQISDLTISGNRMATSLLSRSFVIDMPMMSYINLNRINFNGNTFDGTNNLIFGINALGCLFCNFSDIYTDSNIFTNNINMLNLNSSNSSSLIRVTFSQNTLSNNGLKVYLLVIAGSFNFTQVNFTSNTLGTISRLMHIYTPGIISLNNFSIVGTTITDRSTVSVAFDTVIFLIETGGVFNISNLYIANNNIVGIPKLIYFRNFSDITMISASVFNNTLLGYETAPNLFVLNANTFLYTYQLSINSNTLQDNAVLFVLGASTNSFYFGFDFRNNSIYAISVASIVFSIDALANTTILNSTYTLNYIYGLNAIASIYANRAAGTNRMFIMADTDLTSNTVLENSILISLGSLTIANMNNVTFLSNYMNSDVNSARLLSFGTNTPATLTFCTFRLNHVVGSPKVFTTSRSVLTMINTTFTENIVFGSDSYIYFMQFSGGTVVAINMSIVNNDIQESVMFFYSSGVSLNVTNGLVRNNTILGTYLSARFSYVISCTVRYMQIIIEQNNFTNVLGWSYFMRLDSSSVPGELDLTFQNNLLSGSQSICFYVYSIRYNFTNLKFINNTVERSASFFTFYLSTLGISGGYFYGNMIKNENGYPSSMFQNNGNSMSINDSYFISNTFKDSATGTYQDGSLSFSIQNVTLLNNTFLGSGSFIEAKNKANITVINCFFSGNSLFEASGIIAAHFLSIVTVDSTTFDSNILVNEGILLFVETKGVLNMTGSVFTNNIKMIVGETTNSRAEGVIAVSSATIYLTNISSINSSSLLFSNSGTGLLTMIRIMNVIPTEGERQFISGFRSTITMSDVQIYQESNYTSEKDTWIGLTDSTIYIDNFVLANATTNQGFALSLINTKLTLINSQIQNLRYLSEGSFANANLGSEFIISNATFYEVDSLLTSNSVTSIELSNITYSSSTPANTLTIADSTNVQINNLELFYTSDSIIDYAISISETVSQLNMSQVKIRGSHTSLGAIFLTFQLTTANIVLDSLSLFNNTCIGRYGGAITINKAVSSNFTIQNSNFTLNSAKKSGTNGGRGGAIYLSTYNSAKKPQYNITNSIFDSNYAELNGGAIYVLGVPPSIDNLTLFTNNTIADSVNDIASQAIKMITVNTTDVYKRLLGSKRQLNANLKAQSQGYLYSVGSGQSFDQNLSFVLLDMYDQQVIDDSYSTLSISGLKNSSFKSSITSIQARKGIYRVEGVDFTYKPGEMTTVSFTSNSIEIYQNLKISGTNNPQTIRMSMSFRDCNQGEILLTTGACYQCLSGFASFNYTKNTVTPCTQCESETTICLGGNQVGPNVGAWRMNETANIFLSCPNSAACLGGYTGKTLNATSTCAYGYKGNLCSNCIDGFGKTSVRDAKCSSCEDQDTAYVMMIFIVLFNFSLIGYSTYSALKLASNDQMTQATENPSVVTTVLIKNLINFTQIVSLLGSMPIKWPSAYQNAVSASNQIAVTKPDLFTLDCMYTGMDEVQGTKKVYLKLLLSNLVPIFLICLAVIVWIGIFIRQKKNPLKDKTFLANLTTTIVIICFNLQISTIQTNLEIFKCENLYRTDKPLSFLKNDFDVQCWNPQHKKWIYGLALPAAVTWGLILPGFVFYLIYKYRKNLNDEHVRKKYSFIFRGYTGQKYFWEFVVMIRKYLIISIAVFGSFQSRDFQIYLSVYVIWIAYALEVKNMPFLTEKLNNLEQMSLICAGIVNITGLYFNFVSPTWGLSLSFTVLVFGSTFTYVGAWLKMFAGAFITKIKSNKMTRKVKCLRRLFKIKSIILRQRLPPGFDKEINDEKEESEIKDAPENGTPSASPNQENVIRKLSYDQMLNESSVMHGLNIDLNGSILPEEDYNKEKGARKIDPFELGMTDSPIIPADIRDDIKPMNVRRVEQSCQTDLDSSSMSQMMNDSTVQFKDPAKTRLSIFKKLVLEEPKKETMKKEARPQSAFKTDSLQSSALIQSEILNKLHLDTPMTAAGNIDLTQINDPNKKSNLIERLKEKGIFQDLESDSDSEEESQKS